mgnify:CR=1 FL=1
MYQSLAGRPPRHARSRRHLRRRRRRARSRRAHLPDRPARRSTKSCACRTTRSARRSRTSSTTRDRSWSRRARSAVAGLRTWVERTGVSGERLVAVLSGANMNFDRLRFVAERAEVGEAREALFGVTIPERPGAFREFCADHRPARRDRVQLPAERPRPGAHLRRHRHRVARRTPPSSATTLSGSGLRDRRADRQRSRRSCTCGTWSAAEPGRARTSSSAASSSRASRRADGRFSRRSAAAGTSACSTTATTGRTSGRRHSRASRSRPTRWKDSKFLRRSAMQHQREDSNHAYRMFLT